MMSPAEYDQLDALAMAALVRSGQLTATELCAAAIARAEAVNPHINAVVQPLYEPARQRATAGLPAGPFGGVPFLLKDFGAQYAGVPHTSGSRGATRFRAPGRRRAGAPLAGPPASMCWAKPTCPNSL